MELESLTEALKALADPTRLKIISLLHGRECCVCELIPLFGISQSAVSKHMHRLKQSGLVTEQRRGQWVFYSLNRNRLKAIASALGHLPDLWEPPPEWAEREEGNVCAGAMIADEAKEK